eukprot:CAMPEP_0116857338 /NCGR_PEP_ID=MMETSP0418-20121206/20488_1 /TAXON_ID=1158023 /ORGANISM="Astrosyne radiata, Strain 13vi08-1A" /LENGTH=459 /DNA_ID=CAMNT_0004490991 /DNA_START=13 /DNA_END=1392 /DNA_ORIENTATION=+
MTRPFHILLFVVLCHATPSIVAGGNELHNLVNVRSLTAKLPSRRVEQVSRKEQKPVRPIRRKNTGLIKDSAKSSIRAFGNLISQSGVYYGLHPEHVVHRPRAPGLSDMLDGTLKELRDLREEVKAMKKELAILKRGMGMNAGDDAEGMSPTLLAKRKKAKKFEKIGKDVEKWAEDILWGDQEGWKEVEGWGRYNQDGRTKCYLKWMKDSRGKHANPNDDNVYPCLKLYSTIDAPMEHVCSYLSDENRMQEYNDLVVKHRDLEDVSASSKICWGQTPQILFIKPRDFVTFCFHRWRRDGTQVVVNQACDHKDAPVAKSEGRAYAIRGANFISPHPDDPDKTQFALVAHANPGDLPQWLCEKAVNWLAPVEPFKLFHKINANVIRAGTDLERTAVVSSTPGRSGKPAGLSQMGYACFWPEGGGSDESSRPEPIQSQASENAQNSDGAVDGAQPKESIDSLI